MGSGARRLYRPSHDSLVEAIGVWPLQYKRIGLDRLTRDKTWLPERSQLPARLSCLPLWRTMILQCNIAWPPFQSNRTPNRIHFMDYINSIILGIIEGITEF